MSHLTDWSMQDELLKVKLGYYVYPNLKYFTLCAIGTKYCILTNTRTDDRSTRFLRQTFQARNRKSRHSFSDERIHLQPNPDLHEYACTSACSVRRKIMQLLKFTFIHEKFKMHVPVRTSLNFFSEMQTCIIRWLCWKSSYL